MECSKCDCEILYTDRTETGVYIASATTYDPTGRGSHGEKFYWAVIMPTDAQRVWKRTAPFTAS